MNAHALLACYLHPDPKHLALLFELLFLVDCHISSASTHHLRTLDVLFIMQPTGMLGEGELETQHHKSNGSPGLDGIHVDMNHLKKGEVK